uniref:Adhesion G protein-coupled receptor E1 n=1 Tax=Pelodiscus sinensis TaxID=13735 RepID=K7G356_PELSI
MRGASLCPTHSYRGSRCHLSFILKPNATDDACAKSTVCPSYATCKVIPGGYRCACKWGSVSSTGEQYFMDNSVTCQDIDECAQDPLPCGPNASCQNTDKSFVCECESGYSSSRRVSGTLPSILLPREDSVVQTRAHLHSAQCPEVATCTNTLGGHFCPCKIGFASSFGEQRNIDECSHNPSPCGPNSNCTNTQGSYNCTCRPGYLSASGRDSSTGLTVATEGLSSPSERCHFHSHPGGHYCPCKSSFALSWGEQRFTDPAVQWNESRATLSQIPDQTEPVSVSAQAGNHSCSCSADRAPGWEDTSKRRAHFSEENDLVRKSQNQSLDTAHGSSPEDAPSCHPAQAAYCTLLNSTFRALGEPYEEKNSTVCLEKAAGGFASILEQTSSWSNLSMEQLSVSAAIVLQSVERIVMDVLTNPTENRKLTFRTKELDVQTKVIADGCSRENFVINLGAKGESMEIRCKTVQGSTAQGAAGVAFASYVGMETIMNGSFFQDQKDSSGHAVRMISRVVSAWLTSQTKTNFTDPANYTFEHIMPSNRYEKPKCVSWETTAQRGSWSPAGCRVLRFNTTHTTCNCNHVSSLAVLMAWGEITADFPLFLISHVGLALSLLCLLLAILTFLLCRSIRNVNTSIHLQLCLCLFVADLLFLTAVDSTSHQVGCAVIAGLLHYLFLACFAWMFLEAVVLFLTVRNLGVVNYFSTHSPKMRFLSLFGYGFPALVVAVSAAIMPKGHGRAENCWLSMEKGFIWSFLGPVCAIVGINSVLFAVTLWMLQRKLSSLNSEVSTLKDTRLLTFKAIAQVFILGCTWIFGLFQTGPAAVVMAYLFTILNSLQGVFIFLVHCLLNRQVQEEYKRWFTGKSKSYSEVSMSTLATSSKVSPAGNG